MREHKEENFIQIKDEQVKRTGSFFITYNYMIDKWLRIIGPTAFSVWSTMKRFCNNNSHAIFPRVSQADWAEYIGISTNVFVSACEDMEAAGLMSILKPTGQDKLQHKPCIYTLMDVENIDIQKAVDRINDLREKQSSTKSKVMIKPLSEKNRFTDSIFSSAKNIFKTNEEIKKNENTKLQNLSIEKLQNLSIRGLRTCTPNIEDSNIENSSLKDSNIFINKNITTFSNEKVLNENKKKTYKEKRQLLKQRIQEDKKTFINKKTNSQERNSKRNIEKLSDTVKSVNALSVECSAPPSASPPRQSRVANRAYRIIPSIIQIWNDCDTVSKHRTGTKKYTTIELYFKQLIDGTFGKNKYFDPKWQERMPADVFDLKWPLEELKEAVTHLTRYSMPGYWPENKTAFRDLENLIYNPRTGKSWLVEAMSHPPKPLSETNNKNEYSKYPYIAYLQSTILKALDKPSKPFSLGKLEYGIRSIIEYKNNRKINDKDEEALKMDIISARKFILEYADWLSYNWSNADPDRIGRDSAPFKKYVEYLKYNE